MTEMNDVQQVVMCPKCSGPAKMLGHAPHIEWYCEKCDVSTDGDGTVHEGNKEYKS